MKIFFIYEFIKLVFGIVLVAIGYFQMNNPGNWKGLFDVIACVWMIFFGRLFIVGPLIKISNPLKGHLIYSKRLRINITNGQVIINNLSYPCTIWIFFENSLDFFWGRIVAFFPTQAISVTLQKKVPAKHCNASFELMHTGSFRLMKKIKESWPKFFGTHFDPVKFKPEFIFFHKNVLICFNLQSNIFGTEMEKKL